MNRFQSTPTRILLLAALLFVASAAWTQNVVIDGSFEGSAPPFDNDVNPMWAESSSNFDTPICHPDTPEPNECHPEPDFGARTGSWWAWFGGLDGNGTPPEEGSLTQVVTLPPQDGDSSATLRFWLRIERCSGDVEDFLAVELDAQEFFRVTATDASCGSDVYEERLVNVSSALVAGESTVDLTFFSSVEGNELTNFFVDDIALFACQYPANVTVENKTISGTETHHACMELTAGNDLVLSPTADVGLEAGERVVLISGFRVQPGAKLRVSFNS